MIESKERGTEERDDWRQKVEYLRRGQRCLNAEFGRRPIGTYAYAPVGMGNAESGTK